MKFFRFFLALALLLATLLMGKASPEKEGPENKIKSPSSPFAKTFGSILKEIHYTFIDAKTQKPLWIFKAKEGVEHPGDLWKVSCPEVYFFPPKNPGTLYRFSSQKGSFEGKDKSGTLITLEGEVKALLPSGGVLSTSRCLIKIQGNRERRVWTPKKVTFHSSSPAALLSASSLEGDLIKQEYLFHPPLKIWGEGKFLQETFPTMTSARGFFMVHSAGILKVTQPSRGEARVIFPQKGSLFYHPTFKGKNPPSSFPITFSFSSLEVAGHTSSPGAPSPKSVSHFLAKQGGTFTFQEKGILLKAARYRWDPKEQTIHLRGNPWIEFQKGPHTLYARRGIYHAPSRKLTLLEGFRGNFSTKKKIPGLSKSWKVSGEKVRIHFTAAMKIWEIEAFSGATPLLLENNKKKLTLTGKDFHFFQKDQRALLTSSPEFPLLLQSGKNSIQAREMTYLGLSKRVQFQGEVKGRMEDTSSPLLRHLLKKISKKQSLASLEKSLPLSFKSNSLLLERGEKEDLRMVRLEGEVYIETLRDRLWTDELIYEVPGEVLMISGKGPQIFSGQKVHVQAREMIYLGKSRRLLLKRAIQGFFRPKNLNSKLKRIHFRGEEGEVYLNEKSKIFLLTSGSKKIEFWGQGFKGTGETLTWRGEEEILDLRKVVLLAKDKEKMEIHSNRLIFEGKKKIFHLQGAMKITYWPSPLKEKKIPKGISRFKKDIYPQAPWILEAQEGTGQFDPSKKGKESLLFFRATSPQKVVLSNPQNKIYLYGKELKWDGKKEEALLLGSRDFLPYVTVETLDGIQRITARRIFLQPSRGILLFEDQVKGTFALREKEVRKKPAKIQAWKFFSTSLLFHFSSKEKQPLFLKASGPCLFQREGMTLKGDQIHWDFPKKKITLRGNPFAELQRDSLILRDRVIEYDTEKERIRTLGGGEWKNKPEKKVK